MTKTQIKGVSSTKKRWMLAGGLFAAALVMYLLNATASPLWFDEAIEYFCSKPTRGTAFPTYWTAKSMYQRIAEVYQPPLYNWLMYLWLLVFDSEFGYRLAGIVTSFAGAVGLFKALRPRTDFYWACMGVGFYLFNNQIILYTLECAEYNLMLCMMCWTLCFFLAYSESKRTRDLALFFLFACLSVYSQYGAAFLIVAFYLVILLQNILEKNKKGLIRQLEFSAAAAVFAAAPLLYWFLLPQIRGLGAVTVSHKPCFANGPMLWDLIKSLIQVFLRVLGLPLDTANPAGKLAAIAIPFVLTVFAALALVLKRERGIGRIFAVCVFSWAGYYLATACSFYAYNGWMDSYGTQNVTKAKYALFFLPLWVFALLCGAYQLYTWLKEARPRRVCAVYRTLVLVLVAVYCLFGIWQLFHLQKKADIRDLVSVWEDARGYESTIYVDNWNEANFQFYMQHMDSYRPDCQKRHFTGSLWGGTPEQLEQHLTGLGVFALEDVYGVGSQQSYWDNEAVFRQVMQEHGYSVEVKYDGMAVLVYACRA